MPDSVAMTQDGHNKLRDELRELEGLMPAIKRAIDEARQKGDLSENGDYHAAREELAMVNAKAGLLRTKLINANIVDMSKAPEGVVVLGSTVSLRRVRDDFAVTRTLVGEGESDTGGGRILTSSPIGQATLGHSVGETVTIPLPKGDEDFEITEIK